MTILKNNTRHSNSDLKDLDLRKAQVRLLKAQKTHLASRNRSLQESQELIVTNMIDSPTRRTPRDSPHLHDHPYSVDLMHSLEKNASHAMRVSINEDPHKERPDDKAGIPPTASRLQAPTQKSAVHQDLATISKVNEQILVTKQQKEFIW